MRERIPNTLDDLQNHGLYFSHSSSSQSENATYLSTTGVLSSHMDINNSLDNMKTSDLKSSPLDNTFGLFKNCSKIILATYQKDFIDNKTYSMFHKSNGRPNDSLADSPNGILVGSPVDDSVTSPVKIILYTYMRSGSSFTGELFARDKDTFYLFEPVDGMYSELYGTHAGMFPLDILYYSDGTKR